MQIPRGGGLITTSTEEETAYLGRELGRMLGGGDTVLLRGEIGAGKSVLARGIASALPVPEWYGSPTFTLVNEYDSTPRLYHVDLYRLDEQSVRELGLEEYARDDSVLVVEWADRAPGYLAGLSLQPPLWVDLEQSGLHQRKIYVHGRRRTQPRLFDLART